MSEFGIPGMFEIKAIRTDSDEGKAILNHIPSTYNNQLSPKILKVYKKTSQTINSYRTNFR